MNSHEKYSQGKKKNSHDSLGATPDALLLWRRKKKKKDEEIETEKV